MVLDGRSIETWVLQAREGDSDAYARLVDHFYKRIYLLCLSYVGHVPLAEDLAQDVFLNGLLKLGQLKKPASFGAWIYTMARRLSLNRLREQKQTASLDRDWPAPVSREADRRDLQERVQRLPLELRLPLVLYYFDGRDVPSVAEAMGGSVSHTYSRIRAAVQQLYEMYQEED
jgi:RNA polymerase sigma-70 factor (ECF subfamily)